MAERLLDLGQGLAIYRVGIDEAREQDVNARSMSPAAFDRLTATIAKDGRLESLPLLALTGDDELEIISGHHRTRSGRSAGLTEYFALVDETGLDRDYIRAKQLAHNAIEGEDEAQLVAQIYEAIGDIEARLEAFVTPPTEPMPAMTIPSLDLGMESRTVSVAFMPYQLDRFEAAAAEVAELVPQDTDRLWLLERDMLERWISVTKRLRKVYDVRAMGAVFTRMADLVEEALGLERDPDTEDVVALVDLFGQSTVPADVARQIKARTAGLARTEKAQVLFDVLTGSSKPPDPPPPPPATPPDGWLPDAAELSRA